MSPERMAALVARWVRFYTRGLPPAVAERRVGEIDADLHDHIAHERDRGLGDRRIALGIASRMLRGVPADASWRGPVAGGASRSVLRVALVTACILLVPLVGMLVSDGTHWTAGDFVLAAGLLGGAGTLIELALRRPGSVVLRALAVALGLVAMAAGEADDAPGLVGFGCLLVGAAVVLSVRTARRRG